MVPSCSYTLLGPLIDFSRRNSQLTQLAITRRPGDIALGADYIVKVQRRLDNRCTMSKVFKRWKFMTGLENNFNKEGRGGTKGREEGKQRIYGIKHWGRSKAIPRIHIKGYLGPTFSKEELTTTTTTT
eukprot:2941823-Pleurochrysis_carterae.AAC.1